MATVASLPVPDHQSGQLAPSGKRPDAAAMAAAGQQRDSSARDQWPRPRRSCPRPVAAGPHIANATAITPADRRAPRPENCRSTTNPVGPAWRNTSTPPWPRTVPSSGRSTAASSGPSGRSNASNVVGESRGAWPAVGRVRGRRSVAARTSRHRSRHDASISNFGCSRAYSRAVWRNNMPAARRGGRRGRNSPAAS